MLLYITLEPAAKPSLGSWEHQTSGYITGFGCLSSKLFNSDLLFWFLSSLEILKSFKTHSKIFEMELLTSLHLYMYP